MVEEPKKGKARNDRPHRPDFLDSAEDVLGSLGKPDRKSRPEPGPRKTDRYDSVHFIRYSIVGKRGDSAGKGAVAISINVATHGVALQTSDRLPVGEIVLLEILVRNEPRVHALGEVIHCRQQKDGTFESGIKFLDISDEDYQLLLRLFP